MKTTLFTKQESYSASWLVTFFCTCDMVWVSSCVPLVKKEMREWLVDDRVNVIFSGYWTSRLCGLSRLPSREPGACVLSCQTPCPPVALDLVVSICTGADRWVVDLAAAVSLLAPRQTAPSLPPS